MEWIDILQSFGFPVLSTVVLAYAVKYLFDNNAKQIERIETTHNNEIKAINETLQNNTLVMQELTYLIKDLKEDVKRNENIDNGAGKNN